MELPFSTSLRSVQTSRGYKCAMAKMAPRARFLAIANAFFQLIASTHANVLAISNKLPTEIKIAPILEAFVSYSIEFSSFPDFAGSPLHLRHLASFHSDTSREQFPPKYLFQQSIEQFGQFDRHKTSYTSRWKYPRLRSLQCEAQSCS